MTAHRLPAGGRIDRDRPLRFTFDGLDRVGCHGDTLASALLADGVATVARSLRYDRPRGILTAGIEEPNALVGVEGGDAMTVATTVELCDGLHARSLPGRGRLDPAGDDAVYDTTHAHCEVLVVGAGPAGLAAALAAGRGGARVILVDDAPAPGGSLRSLPGGDAVADWLTEACAELDGLEDVRVLTRSTVLGVYDHGEVIALERRTEHLGADAPPQAARRRLWKVRAGLVVLASGAHERPIAFAGNDRPGVMLAGAARTYLHRFGVCTGREAVVFTADDAAYHAAVELADAGVTVGAVADARAETPAALTAACAERGIEVLPGTVVTAAHGDACLEGVTLRALDAAGRVGGTQRQLPVDLLLVSGGFSPALQLSNHPQGRLRWAGDLAAFVVDTPPPGMVIAGAAAGERTLAACVASGAATAGRAGLAATTVTVPDDGVPTPGAPLALWTVPGEGEPSEWTTHFVDLQRDVTVADVHRAVGAGLRSSEHVKRYTTIGTAHDQGRTSGVLATGVIADALGAAMDTMSPTLQRTPYEPVSFAALAGRDRGRLHDPVRVTALHPWHVEHGAVFEDVGQWKRPRFYPRDGEDMETAVLRECRAARAGVACMDASTLGKIDVHGPDAAELLDRVYTNLMSSLAVGAIRYGVMCRPDGMVFDDGTAIRLAEDRFLVTTTTGNAAAVLDWFEEWLQTEWPDLRVHCTSVTDHWSTVALVGPRSRAVLARLAPDLDVRNEAFAFMRWREADVAGLAARVCRISFSGELAYEINVSAWDGMAVWEAILAAGADEGITPYGTETMHVLRAEKGYPIIGQDTDGTVTPQDLGMDWVVSKKKADFIGLRSFSRPDTRREDRKQLVGLLPVGSDELLPEGAQLIAPDASLTPPVPMLGHVTSSYRSAALDSTFALALVAGGRSRVGDELHVPLGDRTVAVRVTAPVLFDPDGSRRDG